MLRLITTALAIVLLGSVACSPVSETSGRTIYADKCAACHGSSGKGDGELATRLATSPADLTRIAARRDGVWPMLEVMGIIDGYSKRYLPGSEMPIYDEFMEGNLVRFDTGNGVQQNAPAGLLAIVRYLETIQDPKPDRMVP